VVLLRTQTISSQKNQRKTQKAGGCLAAFPETSMRSMLRRPFRWNTTPSRAIGGGFSYPAPRRRDEVVKIDLLKNESVERVKEIWLGYHAQKEFNISDMWTAEEFKEFQECRRSAGSLFIFPVPRDNGHFVVLSQVQEKHILFTYLEDFKRDPHNAQPYLAVTFYDELVDQHRKEEAGPVLVRGDITPLALDRKESNSLLSLVKKFYLERRGDVASFNKGTYDFEKHIADCLQHKVV
jgi:hypothetical protein